MMMGDESGGRLPTETDSISTSFPYKSFNDTLNMFAKVGPYNSGMAPVLSQLLRSETRTPQTPAKYSIVISDSFNNL